MLRKPFAILALGIVLAAVAAPKAQAQPLINASLQAEQLQQTGALVVDIRQPHEWRETGVLPNAHLVTFGDTEAFLAEIATMRAPGQPLVLICRSGNRTAQASRLLAGRIDAPVVNVTGGMLRLLAEGFSPHLPTRAQGCQVC